MGHPTGARLASALPISRLRPDAPFAKQGVRQRRCTRQTNCQAQDGTAAGTSATPAAAATAAGPLSPASAAALRAADSAAPSSTMDSSTVAAADGLTAPATAATPGESVSLGAVAEADTEAEAAAGQLGTADLEWYMQQRGITASIVPALNGGPLPPGCCEVKSLVFLADGHPLVLVLLLESRVDERQLADLLHTGRNRVRLAPAGSLVDLCGYSVGNVPPFGLCRPLPVIVDTAVTRFQRCYAGGGSDESEILIETAELLRAAVATVADISVGSSSSSHGTHKPQAVATSDQPAAAAVPGPEVAAVAAADGPLPLPWQPGQQEVTIVGMVGHKRKIARLLLFLSLVPLPPTEEQGSGSDGSAAGPKPGTAATLRRLWRHPDGGGPCEVQLIMGATLERRLGSEAAAELFKSIRVGQCLRISGRVQPHLYKATAAADVERPPRGEVCDVVVHEVQVVDPAAAAAMAAIAGQLPLLPPPVAATALAPPASQQQQQQQQQPQAVPTAGGTSSRRAAGRAAAGGGSCYQLPVAVQQRVILVDSVAGLQLMEEVLFGGSSNGVSTSGGDGSSSTEEAEGSSRNAEEGPRGFGPSTSTSTSTSSSSTVAVQDGSTVAVQQEYRLVVGMDCEWEPYERGQPHTPVSLLQMATPDTVFLVDMLALCCGTASTGSSSSSIIGTGPTASPADAGSAVGPLVAGVAPAAAAEPVLGGQKQQAGTEQDARSLATPPSIAQHAQQELPPLPQRLSDLLLRLFGDPGIVKAGFGLSTDLSRLCESYPWLPCFGSLGPVALRSHVDVLLLARTALGSQLSHSRRRRISLTSLAELVLGVPIDKSEQCSSWGSRPLRPEQQLYAAADAHALVALYQTLHKRRRGLETPFWLSHFSGKLTDVAAFRPRSYNRSLTATASSTGVSSSSAEQQILNSTASVGIQSSRGRRRHSTSVGPAKSVGQTQQLDVNVDYLLQQYLGKQLPQGGKAAVVRAAAADTGRSEPGRTPSFPRGCGGLLEWRNAFLLFVNLPEAGESQRAAGGSRKYLNQWLWLPAEAEADASCAAAAFLTSEQQPGAVGTTASGATSSSASSDGCLEASGDSGQQQQPEQGQRRLCITWWPGRGHTLEHPVMQRLLAAGTAGEAGTPADVVEGTRSGGEAAVAGRSEQLEHAQQELQQSAVLLFCRAGSSPYVFCGRLRPAAVGSLPALAQPVLSGSSNDTSIATGSGSSSAEGAGCVTWELLDAAELLNAGSNSDGIGSSGNLAAFHQLLHT